MEKFLIDVLGTALEIFVALIFYETVWVIKKIKLRRFIFMILIIAMVDVALSILLQNNYMLTIISIAVMFILSFFFVSNLTSKILLSFGVTAIMFAGEMLISIIVVQMLSIPIEQLQGNLQSYMLGVLVSKLFALFLIYMFRIFFKSTKHDADIQFNMLLAFMPMQSIILCFIVYGYSVISDTLKKSPLGISAIIVSISLVFIMMHVLNNQRKALAYKKEYDLAQLRLEMQIEHYQNLYQSQHNIRAIRHEISDSLVAISGMLKHGQVQEAIDRIDRIHNDVKKTTDVVDTGFPPVDAVIKAKLAKSAEHGIEISYKVLIDVILVVDHFDIAMLISNALDNAIEGTLRSKDPARVIVLDIASASDYISILVENYTSGPIYEDFRTLKPDKNNHGFGIAQMKAITLKYNGDFHPNYDHATGKFSLKILLKNKPA